MKEISHFDDLLCPEYYHEIEGFESRLAVLKLNDVRETLGDCLMSLTYADNKEQDKIKDNVEKNIIRRIHLRHAVIDLNNCYDLLLQVPWFFYRVWEEFNVTGMYHNSKDKSYIEITRNTYEWVENAEKGCKEFRVLKFLECNSDDDLRQLGKKYSEFKKKFIFNNNKDFTIRTIANLIKHNGALKIKEINKPWKLNLKNPGINAENVGLKMEADFSNIENGKVKVLGKVKFNYTDNIYIDIQYKNGELFRGIDYVRKNAAYSIDELYKEAEDYYNNIIQLFEDVYDNINPKLSKSPILKKENEKSIKETVDLDKYFKATD